MKCRPLLSVALLFCAPTHLNAQTNAQTNAPIAVSPEGDFALVIAETNAAKDYPSLRYWGIRGCEWETARTEVLSTSLKGIPRKKLKQTKTSVRFADNLSSRTCEREMVFDAKEQILNAVRCHFAKGIRDRTKRLEVYHQLKTDLVNAYKAPTHSIRSDEIFRGEDVYVQGLGKGYHVEWWGPETIVSLRLSDKDLVLEYRQAPTSKARAMKERVQKTKERKMTPKKPLRGNSK